MISLVFVFLQMLEFALVLILKEADKRRLDESNADTDRIRLRKSRIPKLIPKKLTERNITTDKVAPFEETKRDLNTNDVSQPRQTTFWINTLMFFEKLPLTRRIDFLAFAIYHFSYLLFNIIYWVQY